SRARACCGSLKRLPADAANWSVSASPRIRCASWFSASIASTSRQMLSASAGWFSSRYLSAFSSAAGMPLGTMCFSAYRIETVSRRPPEAPPEPAEGVVELVDDAFLQRNDGVIGDVDRLGADLRAALGDVAEPDARLLLQVRATRFDVERVHLEARQADEEARTREAVLAVVVAQHVAHVLAEETLDALPEFLHPVDVHLLHAPRAVGRRWRRLERRDAPIHAVVPRDVADEVLEHGERLHGRQRDRLAGGKMVHARHAHEARLAVHLRAARPASPRLAVPPAGEIARLVRLYPVDRVEDHHPLVQRHAGHRLAHREQVPEIERGVPAGIVLAVTVDADPTRARPELPERGERVLEVVRGPRDADAGPHHVLEGVLHGVRALAALPLEGRGQLGGNRVDLSGLDARLAGLRAGVRRGAGTRTPAEHQEIAQRVAA